MTNYQTRLNRIEQVLTPADPAARNLAVLYLDGDETAEQAAAWYVAEHGLPSGNAQRILADGLFVRFVTPRRLPNR